LAAGDKGASQKTMITAEDGRLVRLDS